MEGLIEQQKDFGNIQEQEDCWNIPYEEIYGDCDEYKVNYANFCQRYDSDNDYDDNYVSENAIRLQKQIDEYEYALEVQAMYDAEFGTKEQRDEELRQYRLYYARERAISRLQNQQEKNSALQKSV